MTVTIGVPDELGAALTARAQAQGVSLAGFARHLLEQAVQMSLEQGLKPKKSAYGLLAKYGPGPSAEEIDENRKEMFRGFAKDSP